MSGLFSNKELLQQLGRNILDSDTLVIVALDTHGHISAVNKLAEKASGYRAAELVGQKWTNIFAIEKDAKTFSDVIERARSEQSVRTQTSFKQRSGIEKSFSWDFFEVPTEKGESRQIVAIGKEGVTDATHEFDIRQEWKTLTDIVNNMGAGLILLDRERRILWANEKIRQWFGNGELINSFCYEVLHDPNQSEGDCPSFYTFQTKHTGSTSKWVTTTDGSKRFFQFITTPILNDGAETSQVLELIIDITMRKEIEERRVTSEKLAAIADLAKAVAHEIRNPISVIGGFAHRLKHKIPDNHLVQETTDVILQESKRLEDMVRNVNLFLNPRTPKYEKMHVNELLSQTIETMGRVLKAARIEVNPEFDLDLPPQLIDRKQISHVFINILQNAIEAMPEGGKIIITSSMKGGFSEVRIQDTGPGVKEEDADSIFHAFFSRKEERLGLGLTIATQVVHHHGGYINVEKGASGRGALFVIGLPLYTFESTKEA